MSVRHYIALIHKDPGSDFGVSFPDFPGCVTAGGDLDEARGFAEEALGLHIAGLIEDGAEIRGPSSLEAVMDDPNNRSAVAVLVPAKFPAARIVRVNVTLPEDVLAKIDVFAEQRGMNRSAFLVKAAKHEMEAG